MVSDLNDELSLPTQTQRIVPPKAEPDPAEVAAGRNVVIVFELAVVAVIDQVDAGIDALIAHLRIGRDSGAPLFRVVSGEVADSPGFRFSFLEPLGRSRSVRTASPLERKRR